MFSEVLSVTKITHLIYGARAISLTQQTTLLGLFLGLAFLFPIPAFVWSPPPDNSDEPALCLIFPLLHT
jgi:hypothetical protein